MFPPEPTNDPSALLTNLAASLQRANDDVAGTRVLPAAGGVEAHLILERGLTQNVRTPLAQYIRSYVRASGWRVSAMAFSRTYVRLLLSKATSKASKKR